MSVEDSAKSKAAAFLKALDELEREYGCILTDEGYESEPVVYVADQRVQLTGSHDLREVYEAPPRTEGPLTKHDHDMNEMMATTMRMWRDSILRDLYQRPTIYDALERKSNETSSGR